MLFNEFVGLLLCFLSYVNAEWNTKDFMKREHSLIKPYYGSGIEIPFWQFSGSTIVTPNYIRLTSDLQSKVGAIWNSVVRPSTTSSAPFNLSYYS
jgi:mannose-binding lectin 2